MKIEELKGIVDKAASTIQSQAAQIKAMQDQVAALQTDPAKVQALADELNAAMTPPA